MTLWAFQRDGVIGCLQHNTLPSSQSHSPWSFVFVVEIPSSFTAVGWMFGKGPVGRKRLLVETFLREKGPGLPVI